MEGSTWQTMRTTDPRQLEQARDLAHNAVQWLARVANSFLPRAPDHRHILLRWDAGRRTIGTREFEGGLSLELRLPDLHMQFAEHGKPVPHIMDIEDHTPAEVEAWILVELLHRDVDRSRFSKDLPYAMPGLLTGDSTDYSPASCMQTLWWETATSRRPAALMRY